MRILTFDDVSKLKIRKSEAVPVIEEGLKKWRIHSYVTRMAYDRMKMILLELNKPKFKKNYLIRDEEVKHIFLLMKEKIKRKERKIKTKGKKCLK